MYKYYIYCGIYWKSRNFCVDIMIYRYVIGFLGILLYGFKNNYIGIYNILLLYMGFSFIDKCY